MYKSILHPEDLRLNKIGEEVETLCSKLAVELLAEFTEYNPREIENLLSSVMGYEVALSLGRDRRKKLMFESRAKRKCGR